MSCILLLTCLMLYIAHTQSQGECRGSVSPADPNCYFDGSEGHSNNTFCRWYANKKMWYYDWMSGSCNILTYKGCGGNKNRFCTREECIGQCKQSK